LGKYDGQKLQKSSHHKFHHMFPTSSRGR